jgi:hypothetical protein
MIQARQSPPDTSTLECTHCGVAMTESPRSESRVRYYCCPRCHRWASTMYTDAVRRHAGARERRPAEPATVIDFDQIKARMDAWVARLDQDDPFAVLGVSARATPDQVRERYRELARQHHPDRGGDAAEMRRVNEAYEQIRARRG